MLKIEESGMIVVEVVVVVTVLSVETLARQDHGKMIAMGSVTLVSFTIEAKLDKVRGEEMQADGKTAYWNR
ncbi:hypothetical protein BGZ94_004518 [Podila epigama]|nr:hypothetical protein BGZ94_004518 [Podila epigama]